MPCLLLGKITKLCKTLLMFYEVSSINMCIIMQNHSFTYCGINKLHKKPVEKYKKADMFFEQILLLC